MVKEKFLKIAFSIAAIGLGNFAYIQDSFAKVGEALEAKETGESTLSQDNVEGRIGFWTTVIEGLKKLGYAENSDYVQHARRYLDRAHHNKKSGRARHQSKGRHKRQDEDSIPSTEPMHPTMHAAKQPKELGRGRF
jgi:hypothetical protein